MNENVGPNVKRALITTTINVPFNLRDWRAAGLAPEDEIIVAGDLKSPHDSIEEFLRTLPGVNRYLRPEAQEDWACSSEIGWNTIQRRNIALLEAMLLRPDYIITVDDDNFPLSGHHIAAWDAHFRDMNARTYEFVHARDTGWWNVGEMLTPQVMMRGFPLQLRHSLPGLETWDGDHSCKVGVTTSLWLGDPDIDAIQRIETNPRILAQARRDAVLAPGTWCPFNSQATAYLGILAPLMSVWPHVGRYDDIWSSLVAQRVMQEIDYVVRVGSPMVRQDRNKHNFFNDLKNEMLGLEFTWQFAKKLRRMDLASQWGVPHSAALSTDNFVSAMSIIQRELEFEDYLPDALKSFMRAWVTDCYTTLIKE